MLNQPMQQPQANPLQRYDINYMAQKDPSQDYSGLGYALNNLFRGGGLNNILGQMGMGNQPMFGAETDEQQALTNNVLPFLADYFWGNKFRNTDTNQNITPNFYLPSQNNTTIGQS